MTTSLSYKHKAKQIYNICYWQFYCNGIVTAFICYCQFYCHGIVIVSVIVIVIVVIVIVIVVVVVVSFIVMTRSVL